MTVELAIFYILAAFTVWAAGVVVLGRNIVRSAVALIFTFCGMAALYALLEAESELVAGFHVEYSGMRFAMFFLAEYANMIVVSAIATTLFLGGWQGPWISLPGLPPGVAHALFGLFWFQVKCYLLIFVMMWLRWTLARLRVDQLMDFAWKVLLPIAFANLIVTGLVLMLRP